MFSIITNYLEPIAFFLYFIALVVYYRQKPTKAVLILVVFYATVTLLLTVGSYIIGKVKSGNNWTYDLLGLFTAVFIGFYFYKTLRSPAKKKVVLFLICVYLLYAVFRNITLEGQRLFDSIGFSIVSASIAIYVFMYFHQLLKNVSEVNIVKEFNFWLSSGYLIYYVGSFIIFVSYYYLTNKIMKSYTHEERRVLTALWGLHNVLLFLSALSLLTGSLWGTYRKKLD